MAKKNRVELKAYFETNDTPTEAEFANLIDSVVVTNDDGVLPTKTSDLTNDSGFIDGAGVSANETDPIYLAWDKSTGIVIEKSQISDFGSYEPANANIQGHISNTNNPHVTKIENLADVSLTSPQVNDGLVYNGTNWENKAPSGGASTIGWNIETISADKTLLKTSDVYQVLTPSTFLLKVYLPSDAAEGQRFVLMNGNNDGGDTYAVHDPINGAIFTMRAKGVKGFVMTSTGSYEFEDAPNNFKSAINIGYNAVTADRGIAIGANSDSAGLSIAIGTAATVTGGGGGLSIGNSATTSYDGIAIGNRASSYANNIAIGKSSYAQGYKQTVVGDAATSGTSDYGTAVGATSVVSAGSGTAIGYNTKANGTEGTALGYNATVNFKEKSIALGANSQVQHHNSIITHIDYDRNYEKVFLKTTTSDATATRMYTQNNSGSFDVSYHQLLPVEIIVSAQKYQGSEHKAWKLTALITRAGGTMAITGTPIKTVIGETSGATTWDIALGLGSDFFYVEATGQAGNTIYWQAIINTLAWRVS